MRAVLEQLEAAVADEETVLAPLVYVAAQSVSFDEDELRAARRRALLLLAAGGDPRRELDPAGRAVTALANDLDRPGRREELGAALAELRAHAAGLARVEAALGMLAADPDLAWRWVACALLAEELADDTR